MNTISNVIGEERYLHVNAGTTNLTRQPDLNDLEEWSLAHERRSYTSSLSLPNHGVSGPSPRPKYIV